MTEDLLSRVLETENAIAERMQAEEDRISRWLMDRRQEIEREKNTKLQKLEESRRTAKKTATEDARRRVAEMIARADETHRLLSALDDHTLRRLVSNHLNKIRPGQ